METVFSHVIKKRFSRAREDITTDALVYILGSSPGAKKGFINYLKGIHPEITDLHFRSQQKVASSRPDMWGYSGNEPRLFVENKFWAGLTDNQPNTYLLELAKIKSPTLLLFIVPDQRINPLWNEIKKRFSTLDVTYEDAPTKDEDPDWSHA